MDENNLENLIGVVEEVTYYNESNGFCVAEINTGDEALPWWANSVNLP